MVCIPFIELTWMELSRRYMASLPPASSKTGEWPVRTGKCEARKRKNPQAREGLRAKMRTFDEGKEVR